MSNEAVISAPQKMSVEKGKLSWVVPVFEVFMAIGYLILGWNAVTEFISSFDFDAFAEDITNAIYFFIACTVVSTIMCFIPIFKSKSNMYIAVCNIIWLGFNLYGFLGK